MMRMKTKIIMLLLCVIGLMALYPLLMVPPYTEAMPEAISEAIPLEQAAQKTVWYNQVINAAGKTSTVVVGPMEYVTFFLHVNTPPASETITITWQQGATVGGYGYRNEGTSVVISDFETAQDYITYTAYTDGQLYPLHDWTVTPHTGPITASLLMVRR